MYIHAGYSDSGEDIVRICNIEHRIDAVCAKNKNLREDSVHLLYYGFVHSFYI